MKNIFVFSNKQSVGGAIVFYIAWLLMIVVLAAIVGVIIGSGSTDGDVESAFSRGVTIGQWVAVIACGLISILILKSKHMLSSVVSIVWILGTLVLAFFVGALGGLIIPAILSAQNSKA